jgi:hypothetical protein
VHVIWHEDVPTNIGVQYSGGSTAVIPEKIMSGVVGKKRDAVRGADREKEQWSMPVRVNPAQAT